MLVSLVQPVAIQSAEFCTICNLCRLFFEITEAQTILEYSMIGLVVVLKVVIKVSFYLRHLVDVSALIIFIVLQASPFVCVICSPKLSLGSKINPSVN